MAEPIAKLKNLRVEILPRGGNHKMWVDVRSHWSNEYRRPPGRSIRYMVSSDTDIVCIGELSSSPYAIYSRDRSIGWSKDEKRTKIGHDVGILSTCGSSPKYRRVLGGKLASIVGISDILADEWRLRYGDELSHVETMGLYGRSSQYTRVDLPRKSGGKTKLRLIGYTTGKMDLSNVPKDIIDTIMKSGEKRNGWKENSCRYRRLSAGLKRIGYTPHPASKKGVYLADRGRSPHVCPVQYWVTRWYEKRIERLPKLNGKREKQ